MNNSPCEYCGKTDNAPDAKKCGGCGAKIEEVKTTSYRQAYSKWGPEFYRGYIVFFICESFGISDTITVQFWLGDRLVDTLTVAREVLEQFRGEAYELYDPLPFFYDLLKVSQGEQEVLRIEQQNHGRPALFEIRRIETQAEQDAHRLASLSKEELYRELAKK